jgi:hypothetical protein
MHTTEINSSQKAEHETLYLLYNPNALNPQYIPNHSMLKPELRYIINYDRC